MKNLFAVAVITAVLFFSCEKNASTPQQVDIIEVNGNIQTQVDAFKNSLGVLNTTPGAIGGHREINWDSVPDSLLNKPLPENFFNQTTPDALASNQRGLTYNPGTFVVSNDGFSSINSEAASEFSSFSGNNTFANTVASKWDIQFKETGTNNDASVQAFALVFSDVDEDSSTSAEFFNDDKSLGKYFVPAHDATSSFSFLGIHFHNNERITKVTIMHDGFLAEGTKDISEGGSKDLIVLDDFIYSEPVAK
jgi:hypothetical protein